MRRFHEIAPGVLVATAELYTTTSTVVTGAGGGCLVIDPAVAVSDLAGLASRLTGTGLKPRVGFATHPHWDHVLWHRDLGEVVPRYATPTAVATTQRRRGELISETDAEVPGHDPELVGRLVALPAGHIPWDGPRAEVISHDGHAPGHGAVFLPDTGVLMAGDMLSDIEMPLLDVAGADPLGDYRAGLERLAALADGVRWLVPGHGSVGDAGEFRRRLTADLRYLEQLEAGDDFEDPRCNQDWLREEFEAQRRVVAR